MRWGLYVVVFAVTAALRYLMLGDGFPNDHFVYITSGWQMLFGEWPTRDWVDPGLPLMFLASAAAQTVFGPTLLAEAVLVSVAFGLAAALTTAAVLELTGSLGVAVVATLLEVAVLPRTYGYPKVLVYALAFLCFFRYVNRPGASRLVAMAVSIAVAFLFRHDHGLFLGIGGALTVLLTPDGRAVRARFGLATALGALSLLLVLPYLLYVQVNGGLVTYLQTGLEFSRREAARQWHVWPAVFGDALPWLSALVYELHVLPAAALIGLVALRRHPRARVFAATVVPTAVVAVMVNYNFVRDPLMTRVPDAIVPAVVLGAWLFDRARDARKAQPFVLACVLVALGVFSASVQEAGSVWESFDRTDLRTEWDHLPRLFRERKETLQARMVESQVPTEATRRLRPFFQYLDRCTTQEHRLLVGGYLVEVPFFAQRRFAAGQQYFGGSFVGTEASERTALFRLREQVVPFVIMPSDYEADFDRYFPVMSGYVRSRYVPLTTVPVDDEIALHVLLDTGVPSTGRDEATGWPCFRPN